MTVGEHDEVGERALEDYFRVDWYRRYLNEASFYVILFPMVVTNGARSI